MNTVTIEIGKTYTYTNSFNYTTTLIVTRVTSSSVFYANVIGGRELRMSLNSFKIYSLAK